MTKTPLFIVFAGLICGTACSRVAVVDPKVSGAQALQRAIVFGRTTWDTKTMEETTDSTLLAKGFTIHGKSSDGQTDFTDNTIWDSVSCNFRTTLDHYYPSGKGITMDFEAVYPLDLKMTSDGGLSYSLTCSDDVVVSFRKGVTENETPVMLEFRHILSKVSVCVSPLVPDIEYSIGQIRISTPERGRYSFSDMSWQEFEGIREYRVDNSSAISVFPGKVVITVSWSTFRNGVMTGDYCRSLEINVEMGRHNIVGLILSDDQSSECEFKVEIYPWEEKEMNINLE